jgi:phenylpropionate dioxygenase-like ring-hydroxylating dioxygenase large terminal subunit
VAMDITRDFPYDYSLLMENLLDVGHVHFTHHGTISRRDRAPEVCCIPGDTHSRQSTEELQRQESFPRE